MMEVKVLFMATGNIEEIKISSDLWVGLHKHRGINHFFNKEKDLFLKKYDLKPSYFNLNCLDKFKGVILTDIQILKLKNDKGGIKK